MLRAIQSLFVLLVLLLIVSCGSGAPDSATPVEPEPPASTISVVPEGASLLDGGLRLVPLAGGEIWFAPLSEARVSLSKDGEGWLLSVERESAGHFSGAAFKVELDSTRYHVGELIPAAEISERALEFIQGGEVALALKGGGQISLEGELFSLRIERGADKSVSAYQVGPAPVEVQAAQDGADIVISWTDDFQGDANGDGTISGLDIFPIATLFQQESDWNGHTAENPLANCADLNRDGTVSGLDVFIIATRFQTTITGYNVWFSDDGTDFLQLNGAPVGRGTEKAGCYPVSDYSHGSAVDGTNWYYVEAYDSNSGQTSGASGTASVEKLHVPGKVIDLEATDTTYDDRIELSWQPTTEADEDGYYVYRGETNDVDEMTQIGDTTELTYGDSAELTPLKKYYYVVRAYNENGAGEVPRTVNGRMGFPAVTGVSATDGEFNDHIVVTWDEFIGATGYEIFRSNEQTDPDPDMLGQTFELTYEDDDVVNTEDYWYFVRAFNDHGSGELSAPDSGYTPNPETRLLLVYNTASQISIDVKDYYADRITGREIPETHILGITTVTTEECTRAEFDDNIKDPIASYLTSSGLKNSIKYILLCKGIPIRVGENNPPYKPSVDSELCLIYQDYDKNAWRYNPYFVDVTGEYPHDDYNFTPFIPFGHSFTGWDPYLGETYSVDMTYLVGRLDGYTLDDVKGIIDRAKNPYRGGDGYVIIDDVPKDYDQMQTLKAYLDGEDYTNYYYENTSGEFVTADTINNLTISDHVQFYVGHGTHHPGNPGINYIKNNLNFGLLNGAAFISYESYNCVSFVEGNNQGQSLIGDWLKNDVGGTVAIGNVAEPYAHTVGWEDKVFPAMMEGYPWIESAYMGLIAISWQQVVVGDPLMTIN